MTRLLLRLLLIWTGEPYLPRSAVLGFAGPDSECGRLIRERLVALRRA